MGRNKLNIGNCLNGCNRLAYCRGVCVRCYRQLHYIEHERSRRYPDGISKDRECEVGTTRVGNDGYIYIKVLKNYNNSSRDWMPEHRYVMEQHLGRRLLLEENIHHINGNKSDNNIKNLELWVTKQPKGQRPEDLVEYAKWILETYDKEKI